MPPVRSTNTVRGGGLAANIPSCLSNRCRFCVLLLVACVLALGVLRPRPWSRSPGAGLAEKRSEWPSGHHDIHAQRSAGGQASQERAGDSEVLEAGSLWYRYGKPFKPIHLHRVAFGFNAASVGNPSLLFYGQLLSGVFRASKEQYIALVLKNGRLTVKTKRTTVDGTSSNTKTLNLPKPVKAGTWYLTCLSIVPTLAVAILEVRTTLQVKRGMWKCFKKESETAGSSTFVIDSGLYFGAVVDVTNTPGLTGELSLGAFHGGIAGTFLLNNKEVELSAESSRPPAESWETSLSQLDLSGPIATKLTKRKTPLNAVSFQKFPIVSAVSQNHALEIHDMVSSVVYKMPKRGIIVYDMGLHGKSAENIASLCNVTIRQYRRDLFPQLLENLYHYRWKAPLVYGAFLEFGGVIWADSSIRFQYQLEHVPLVSDGYGFVGLTGQGSSPVGAFTHDGTLTALGVSRSVIAHSDMTIGTANIWQGEAGGVCKVALEHWVRCAFVKECMAPEGANMDYNLCRKEEKKYGNFIGCHRFDQSAISVIMAKIFVGQSTSNYLVKSNRLVLARRRPTEQFPRCYGNALL